MYVFNILNHHYSFFANRIIRVAPHLNCIVVIETCLLIKDDEDDDRKFRQLEKVAKACNEMPRGRQHKMVFGQCRSYQEREEKLKQLLVRAGMNGESFSRSRLNAGAMSQATLFITCLAL